MSSTISRAAFTTSSEVGRQSFSGWNSVAPRCTKRTPFDRTYWSSGRIGCSTVRETIVLSRSVERKGICCQLDDHIASCLPRELLTPLLVRQPTVTHLLRGRARTAVHARLDDGEASGDMDERARLLGRHAPACCRVWCVRSAKHEASRRISVVISGGWSRYRISSPPLSELSGYSAWSTWFSREKHEVQ